MGAFEQFDFNLYVAQQLMGALHIHGKSEAERKKTEIAVVQAIQAIAPQDKAEALLASQMVALNEAAMECMKRAAIPDQVLYARKFNLQMAVKLNRAFVLSMEALDRRRGKGRQKIEVHHVHVHEGGQAIVGNVQTKGGGKKS